VVQLEGEVELDEVYIVAGHKGNPEAVKKKGRIGRRRRLKGDRGRGTLEKEKPPVFGMIQRGGRVLLRMLANVQRKRIKPIIEKAIAKGTLVFTDEYEIYGKRGWAMNIKRYATVKASMRGMKMGMVFTKSM
jgi:transposase-like protein